MKNFFRKNRLAYLILLVLLATFIFFFMKAWPNRQSQRYVAVIFGTLYFLWGVITHLKSKKINSEIIFEYLSVSMLATLIIVLITL